MYSEMFTSSSPKVKKVRKTRSNKGKPRAPRKVTTLARINGRKYLNPSPNFFDPSPRAKPMKKRSPVLKAKGDPKKLPLKPKGNKGLTACNKASIKGTIKETKRGKLYYITKSGSMRYCSDMTKIIKPKSKAMKPMSPQDKKLYQMLSKSAKKSKAKSPIKPKAKSPIKSKAKSPIKSKAKSPIKSKAKSPKSSPKSNAIAKQLQKTLGMSPVFLPMTPLKVSPLKVNVKDPKTKKLYVGKQGPLSTLKVGNVVKDLKTNKTYVVAIVKRPGKQGIKSFKLKK